MPLSFEDVWNLVRESVVGFVDDDALSHGAAMAFYATTSLAPVLLIVVAIAGVAFGHDAAQLALSAQISGLMGAESAGILEDVLKGASAKSSGTVAAILGTVTLFITASGIFGEMQQSLNTIWKVEPHGSSISRLVRARGKSGSCGCTRFHAARIPGGECRNLDTRRLHQRSIAVRHNRFKRHQYHCVLYSDFCDVRGDL